MQASDSISAADRSLMRQLTVGLLVVLFLTALISNLHTLYAGKFHDVTGEAKWIWLQGARRSGEPVAFFATRSFDLPESRLYARLKLLADPEYTLYVNGREVGSRRVTGSTADDERRLALYDLSEVVRTGRNRIVISVRAPKGVGGLIGALDLEPERQNWLVTDESWRIHRRWSAELLVREPAVANPEEPDVLGEPPLGRWNFPRLERVELRTASSDVLEPVSRFAVAASIPEIRTVGGIAVAVAQRVEGTAFDFGFTTGRVLLRAVANRSGNEAVQVRLANDRSELPQTEWNLRTVVFAPGETTVMLPETYNFRYVLVIGQGVTAAVVREPQ